MAEISTCYIQDKDIIYDYDRGEYFFHVPGRGRQWTCCNLDTELNILYDQVLRNLYFYGGYNVLYSEFFYKELLVKGFFK